MQPAPRTGFDPSAGRVFRGQSPGKRREKLHQALVVTIPRVVAGVGGGTCPEEDAGKEEVPYDSSSIDEAGLNARPSRPALIRFPSFALRVIVVVIPSHVDIPVGVGGHNFQQGLVTAP
eukprot:3311898-Heterocapsa_arctica.AAC.1